MPLNKEGRKTEEQKWYCCDEMKVIGNNASLFARRLNGA
jgi:hypothetical protein